MMFASDFPISYSPETTHENMGTNATDWNQQPPESVPWGVYSQTRVTQFSGSQDCDYNRQVQAPSLDLSLWNAPERSWEDQHCFPFTKPVKRKGDDLIDSMSRKQFITEEKIAAHLSQLHISPSSRVEAPSTSKSDIEKNSPLFGGFKVGPDSKLVLSNELIKLQQESSIPQSILDSMAKPTMAVVLWQPRNQVHLLTNPSQLNQPPEESTAERDEARNNDAEIEVVEDDTNNNEAITDLNLRQANQQNSLEPIDLDMDDL